MAKDKQPEPKNPLQVETSPAKPVSRADKPMQQARRVETEPIATLQESQVKLNAMDAAFKKMSARGTPDAATNLTAQNEPKPMAPVARKGRVAEVQAEDAEAQHQGDQLRHLEKEMQHTPLEWSIKTQLLGPI